VQLSLRTRSYALRRPLEAAWGTLTAREIVEVELRAGDGRVGRGEAAPLEPYDGVPLGAVLAALDAYGAILRVLPERLARADVLDACAAERALPQALAAIDLALWDVEGRRAGRAAAHLIAAGAAASVPVNATVGAVDRAGAAAEATRAAEAGFGCVKVKVGVGDDAGRVAAVRAAVGPDVAIRVDANGAWHDAEEALANLGHLAPAGIELCEEPVHGAEALRAVAAGSPVRIAADESAGALLDGGVDAVCLKIGRCGGISGVLRDAARARAAGVDVYLASTFDGPVGIAGALQAAAALAAERPLLPCGLATLEALEGAPTLGVAEGAIALPPGDGLGTLA
jgi:L-Ala-D/L-Glu epimerase